LAAIFLGLCYGPINPSSTDILARVSPARWRPLIFSIKQTGMPAGAALAGALLPAIALTQGWQAALATAGAMALIVAVLVQPLRRRLDSGRDAGAPVRASGIAEPLKLVWRTPALRHLAVVVFLFAGAQVALATFYVVFLTEALALPLTTAGAIYAILQVSAIVGRLFWGWLADRHVPTIRLLTGLGLAMAAATATGGLMTPDWPLWLVAAVSCAIGLTSHGWNGIFFAELVKHAPPERMADAAGGVQFANLAGVACGPPLFALIVILGNSYLPAFLTAALAMAAAGLFLKLKFKNR
jgi:MFS family permease